MNQSKNKGAQLRVGSEADAPVATLLGRAVLLAATGAVRGAAELLFRRSNWPAEAQCLERAGQVEIRTRLN